MVWKKMIKHFKFSIRDWGIIQRLFGFSAATQVLKISFVEVPRILGFSRLLGFLVLGFLGKGK